MDDVAQLAGVSRALVSLVMRDSPKVSDRSRAAVLAAADELGYRPNLMARQLASNRTMTIGLVLNDLHNPFFAELADGVHREALASGYRVVLAAGFGQADGEANAAATFLEYRVDGLILAGPRLPESQIIDLAVETKLTLVGRSSTSDKLDSVNNDERLGAQLAVDHLVGLGHRDIAHIDGGVGAGAKGRAEGFMAAMRARGLAEHARVIAGDFSEAAGIKAVNRLIDDDRPLSAIFAANDLVATGALHRLHELGIDVPAEVSLVGYDNTSLAGLGHVDLSTVNQPRALMGQLATRLIIDRLDSGAAAGTHHILAPNFIARSTTAPAITALGLSSGVHNP